MTVADKDGSMSGSSGSFSVVAGAAVVDGSDATDDTLVLDFSGAGTYTLNGGAPQSLSGLTNLTFNGGAGGNDTLTLSGGSFSSGTVTYANVNDGTIQLGGLTIHYTGLEPVDMTGTTVNNIVLNLPNTDNPDVVLNASGGNLTLSGSTFESTVFAAPSAGGSITINGGNGDDNITVENSALSSNYSISVNGGLQTGEDILLVDANNAFAYDTSPPSSPSGEIRVAGKQNTTYTGIEHHDVLNAGASPNVLYVDDNFSNPTPGQDPDGAGPAVDFGVDSFSSISAALSQAVNGDHIEVYTGTYAESAGLDISQTGLVIDAIDGPGTVNVNAASALTGIMIAPAASATISGINLSGFSSTGVDDQGSLTMNSDTVSGGLTGIWVDSGHLTMTGSTVENATIFDLQESGSSSTVNISLSNLLGTAGTFPLAGIIISAGTADIENAIITHDSRGVLVNASAGSVKVSGSDLSGNAVRAVENATATIVNASSNWWGTTNETGVLGQTVGSVDITPYLTSNSNSAPGGIGFQGDFSHLIVTTKGAQSGAAGRITEGVADATDGGTVSVNAGTYSETVKITHPVNLIGANETADPTHGGSRSAETIVVPAVVGADPYSGTHTFLMEVLSDNVSIKGFTLDGSNSALGTQGVALTETGATPIYAQAVEGIAAYDPTGVGDISANSSLPGTSANPANLMIENNIIENLSYQGIDLGWGTTSNATAGNTISHNLIQNIGAFNDEGDAVRLYNNFYADVTNNQIFNVRMGVETGNFYQTNPGSTGSIENNDIQARRRGVFYNLIYNNATTIPVEHNTITAATDDPSIVAGASLWTGVYIISQEGTVTATFLDNKIDGTGNSYATSAGYTVLSTDSTSHVTISGDSSSDNSISHVSYGVWEDSAAPNGFGAASTDMAVTISGLKISASTYGIFVD
ncbi:MAG TPA: hypothetical protein VGI75_00400, partial [Pirellulales bacterium]